MLLEEKMSIEECMLTRYYSDKLSFDFNENQKELLSQIRDFATFINEDIKPKSVIEFGCASGLLISQLNSLGINVFGFEKNQYLIDNAKDDIKNRIKDFDSISKILQMNSGKKVDLAIALNVLDDLNDDEETDFLNLLCNISNDIIFSFNSNISDSTCFNVKQIEYWSEKMYERGFFRDLNFNFKSSSSTEKIAKKCNIFRFIRKNVDKGKIIQNYERNIRLINNYYDENLDLINDIQVKKLINYQNEKINKLETKLEKLENEKKECYHKLKKNKNEIKSLTAEREFFEIKLNNKKNQLKKIKKSVWWKLGNPFRKVEKEKNANEDDLASLEDIRAEKKLKNKMDKLFLGKSLDVSVFVDPEFAIKQTETKFITDIKFSILVPLYNTKKVFLKQMIDSVINQTYRNWELCLADASDFKHDYVKKICEQYAEEFPNIKYKKLIKNKGISENTNEAIRLATGNFISLLDHDDVLHPSALFETVKTIIEDKADFTYTDETKFESDLRITFGTHLKPDFSIDNLRSNNYICHFSSFSRELLDEVGYFNSDFDGSQDHDLMLRLAERAKKIVHIPHVLYYWRCHQESVASDIGAKTYAIDAGVNAVTKHLERLNIDAEVSNVPNVGAIYSVKYAVKNNPLASIIISSLGNAKALKRCINSIKRFTDYKNYEIIAIVKNTVPKNEVIFNDEVYKYVNLDFLNVKEETNAKRQKKFESKAKLAENELLSQNKQVYKEIENMDNVKIVYWDQPYNYSAMNNYGVKIAKGSCFVFLSDNAIVFDDYWLESLLGFLSREDVCAVGPKVLYRFGKIKSTGLTLSNKDLVRSLHDGFPSESPGYFGRAVYSNDCMALSYICMAVKRTDFLDVGGFSESLSVLYSDVDLCLKLRKNGLIVYDAYSQIYYHDFITDKFNKLDSANVTENEQENIFKEKWYNVIEYGDPYYNKGFTPEGLTFSENVEIKYGKEKSLD